MSRTCVGMKNLDSIIENCSIAWLKEFDSKLDYFYRRPYCARWSTSAFECKDWVYTYGTRSEQSNAPIETNSMRPIRFWISGTVSRSCLVRLVLWVFRIETYLRKWSINQERLGQILTGKKHMDILIPTFIPYRGKHVRRPGSRACIFWNSCMVWNSTTSKLQHNTPGAHSHMP